MNIMEQKQVELDIEMAKNLILDKVNFNDFSSGLDFKEYSKINFASNEQLQILFEKIDLSRFRKGLSVLASGDQYLNMVCKGVLELDAFDINRLPEYSAIGLKKTAMSVFNYNEFVSFINKIHEIESLPIIKYVVSCAPEKHKKFWEEILYITKYAGVSPFVISEIDITKANLYCANKELYEQTKANLEKATINVHTIDVGDIPSIMSSYDFIYLSNIIDYYLIGQLNKLGKEEVAKRKLELIKNIYEKNLNQDGEFIYKYNFGQTKEEIHKIERDLKNYNQARYDLEEDTALSLRKNPP